MKCSNLTKLGFIWFFAFVILLLSSSFSFSQTNSLQFENISDQEGQLHFRIDYAMEDHLGFIWFATNSGLFRYDGYEMRGYLHNVLDTTTISSPGVHSIVEDDEGRIWISTMYGINLFDRRTGEFKRYKPTKIKTTDKGSNNLFELLLDRNNRLFALGTRQIYLFDKDNFIFKPLIEIDSTKVRNPHTFFEAQDGVVWVGTSRGLVKIGSGETFGKEVQVTANERDGYNRYITAIEQAENGKLWIGTSSGLALWDPISGELEIDILPGEFAKQRLNDLCKLKNGNLMISLANNGIGMLSTTGIFQHYTADVDKLYALQDNHVLNMMEDQFGNIWICSLTGVSKISADNTGFEVIQNNERTYHSSNSIIQMLKDRSGTLWMNTEMGLYKKKEGEDFGQPVELSSYQGNPMIGSWFYEDALGSIWLPMKDSGIWIKEVKSKTFKPFQSDQELGKVQIYKIVEDEKDPNLLWIGNSSGICKYNIKTEESSWYKPQDQIEELKTNKVIVFDEMEDEIWLYYTYYNSIGRFDKRTGKYEIKRPPSEKQNILEGVFRDMKISKDGNVWIATNFGLIQYNIQKDSFQIYTHKDGLLANDLNAVVVDMSNNVWVTGNDFVGKLDYEKGLFTSFDASSKIKKFVSRSKYMDKDGHLFFGATNGVYTFHPDSIKINQIPPKIILTDFKVRDNSYLLNQAFEYTSDILLSHDQNDISFDFSGIQFTNPDAIQYRCMLEGFDPNWRELKNIHTKSYTNLNPGGYSFRVQAAGLDGIWGDNELNIALRITPPITQTRWFRAMIALLILSLLYAILRVWQHQQSLKRKKDIAEKAAEYRMQFLAHASHEIRTPMNAIIGLSGLAKETNLDSEQMEYISTIEKSSQNLLAIINELLDHSKLESGLFKFKSEAFSLSVILNQLNSMFQVMAKEKNIEFKVELSEDVPVHLIGDGLRLSQILTNLIGNAIKFTEEGSVSIKINSSKKNDNNELISFEIVDTGIGISDEKLTRIFERFYEVSEKMSAGTGLGLYITKHLIEQQGGQLDIQSIVGKGTHVKVAMNFKTAAKVKDITLPVEQIYLFSDLEILTVDDAPFNHLVMKEMLKKRIPNAKLTTANSGNEALQLIAENHFDIIIMDVKMPEMDGFETTLKIRAMKGHLETIPILGATASAMPVQIQKCFDSGMNDVISKPIDIKELVKKLYFLTQKVEHDQS